jgi:uncharacterized protein (DUF1697 family)
MAWVVFLRGVNVGGHKAFSPSALAKELAEFGVVNIGAAGTLVIRKSVGQKALRLEFTRRLPFATDLMICPSREIIELAKDDSFPAPPVGTDRFISVLAKRPRTLPRLPLSKPDGDGWLVKIVDVSGRYALTLRKRLAQGKLYSNEVVEKTLGVAATTRNWNTMTAICKVLERNES